MRNSKNTRRAAQSPQWKEEGLANGVVNVYQKGNKKRERKEDEPESQDV